MDKNNIKTTRKHIFIPLAFSLIFVIFYNLEIDLYLKSVIIPFMLLLFSNILIYKDDKNINKKAYLMLIPIFLILVSDLIVHIDFSNKMLNILILPFLLTMFFFLLVNKNYTISFNNLSLSFLIFPKSLFSNLSFLNTGIIEKKKFTNIFIGIVFGGGISLIIIPLLMGADDYFSSFIGKIFSIFNFDISNIVIFIISFVILFSISINIMRIKNIKTKEISKGGLDKVIIITTLIIVNSIFILFLISEISKLCGNFLQLPKGYIYSSYAREGFFQLLFVTLINFSIIVYLIYKEKNSMDEKRIKWLCLLLVVFSILLIFNSYYRMFLYINKYGFTPLRLQVILFLAMELVLFSLVVKKTLYNLKNEGFIFFIIMLVFYIMNLFICNDLFIKLIS